MAIASGGCRHHTVDFKVIFLYFAKTWKFVYIFAKKLKLIVPLPIA